ncbi:MAG: hypothetical protein ACKO0M_13175 [Cyanobium sp.]
MSSSTLAQRWWVPCSSADVQGELDRLCATLRRNRTVYGYLSSEAALVANLSLLENLWLPHAWRAGWSRRSCLRRLEALFEHCGSLPDPDPDLLNLRDFFFCRPAQLSPQQIRQAVILRAALGQPRVVLIDPGWSTWSASMQLLAPAAWLLVAVDPDPLMTGVTWSNLSPEDARECLR